ncbi:MAG: glycosyltransferase family 2 protein [Chloroflexi bacterium]|nr:glycosyltransferase family 2 protein [Chloroflexota bacterium]
MVAVKAQDRSLPEGLNIREVPQPHFDGIVVAVIPAYNEERFIGSVVLLTRNYVDAVVVVDDGSSDRTAQIAHLAGATVVRHKVNKGKGEALNTGFKKARELFLPNAVVTLDADWQHLPEELPKVVKPITDGEADIVIGSRYLEQTSEVPLQRVMGHRGFTMMINALSGTQVSDSQSGFRAFSLNAIKNITFNTKGFGVESEMQFVASDQQLRVLEVPITIRYLDRPKRSVVRHGLNVLTSVLRLMGQHRPLLFFWLMGGVSLVVAFALGLAELEQYRLNNTVDIVLAMLIVFLLTSGSVALFTGIILHTLRGFVLELIRPVISREN